MAWCNEDARQQNPPMQMRALFVILITFTDLNGPKALLETFSDAMSEDFEHYMRRLRNIYNKLPTWMLLMDLQERLKSAGHGTLFQRMGIVTDEMQQAVAHASRQTCSCAITATSMPKYVQQQKNKVLLQVHT